MSLSLYFQVATREVNLPSEAQFQLWAALPLREDARVLALTLRLVDEAESEALNTTFRQRAKPTNILSFAYGVEDQDPEDEAFLFGDLVVCAPVVLAEAEAQGKTSEAHFAHLTLHGVLHLLGYNHEDAEEAALMEGLEIRYLADLGYGNPYE